MIVSAIIPVHNEEGNVIPVYRELKGILQKITTDFEIIIVDDGSKDTTLDKLLSLKSKEEKLRIIQFKKNYGKSAALSAGFDNAEGDSIITLDGDGQDDPNNIPNLISTLTEEYDFVCGWRVKRNDTFLKKTSSKIYNFLNRVINRSIIHDNNCMLRIYKKEAVSDLQLTKGAHRYLPTILTKKGFRIAEIEVNHRPRLTGKSSYGFKRLFVGLFHLFRFRFVERIKPKSIYVIEKKYGFE